MVEIERGLVDSGLRGRGGVDPPKPRTVRGSGSTPGGALGVANPIDGQSGPLGVRSQQSSPSHRKEITCSRYIFGPPKGRFPGLGHNSGLRALPGFCSEIGGLLPMAPCGRSSLYYLRQASNFPAASANVRNQCASRHSTIGYDSPVEIERRVA